MWVAGKTRSEQRVFWASRFVGVPLPGEWLSSPHNGQVAERLKAPLC
jgi:hypothetical protein